jgi:hypothetical protein
MEIVRNTLQVVEISNGFALYGQTSAGATTFIAHLGDGADGLPDIADPDLPEAYDFTVAESTDAIVDCPQCGGTGLLIPGATCGMWAGLLPWPDDIASEICDLCDGAGEVPPNLAKEYKHAAAAELPF